MVVIRSIYDGHEREKGFESTKPSMTQQEFRDECDINVIMYRYQTLEAPLVEPLTAAQARQPLFGDFSDLPDLQTAQNKLIEAQDMFMSLPSSIRRRFDNDALLFLEFCQDEKNVDEMRDLGILPKVYTDNQGKEYYIRDGLPYYLKPSGHGPVVKPAEPQNVPPVQESEMTV